MTEFQRNTFHRAGKICAAPMQENAVLCREEVKICFSSKLQIAFLHGWKADSIFCAQTEFHSESRSGIFRVCYCRKYVAVWKWSAALPRTERVRDAVSLRFGHRLLKGRVGHTIHTWRPVWSAYAWPRLSMCGYTLDPAFVSIRLPQGTTGYHSVIL